MQAEAQAAYHPVCAVQAWQYAATLGSDQLMNWPLEHCTGIHEGVRRLSVSHPGLEHQRQGRDRLSECREPAAGMAPGMLTPVAPTQLHPGCG